MRNMGGNIGCLQGIQNFTLGLQLAQRNAVTQETALCCPVEPVNVIVVSGQAEMCPNSADSAVQMETLLAGLTGRKDMQGSLAAVPVILWTLPCPRMPRACFMAGKWLMDVVLAKGSPQPPKHAHDASAVAATTRQLRDADLI